MKYLQINELKEGMRIAKPIYNKKGVLLFGRGATLRQSSITNIESLNLFGLYILEPTEPVPPVSEEEEEFELFEATSSYILTEGLADVLAGALPKKIESLAIDIQKRFGSLYDKINFLQTIRNPDDYVYRHSLNVAILTALITSRLKMTRNDQYYLIISALLHDIGKLLCPPEILNKSGKLTDDELKTIRTCEMDGYNLIRENMMLSANIRRYFVQMSEELMHRMHDNAPESEHRILLGTKILKIADLYDILTAMRVYKKPMSEFSAISYMLNREEEFDENIVDALIESIHVLPVSACVELTNGEKGLILSENESNPFRPLILSFDKNIVYDLSHRKVYDEVRIKDILKTMDNRFIMSPELVEKYYDSLKE